MDIKKDETLKNEEQTVVTETSNVVNETETSVDKAETESPKEEDTVEEKVDSFKEGNTLPLKRLSEKLMYELMEVPTASKHEYRMVTFIILWAKRNGINYEMDDYGNIYLTKGTLDGAESYPCVTAHLDTVQEKQKLYAKAGIKLEVKTKTDVNGKHRIYVDNFGIGGDDKAGVLLGLSMFNYVDKLKACFFLEEETGCQGSKHLNKDWFKDVGYVIGYDSPDLNRAAYSCSGTKLMNKEFFENNGLKELCAKHGLNDFRAEPFTDVVQIRQQTEIICMNFGTGYYLCHTDNEYCVIEDMDAALDMGVEIIEKLGYDEYKMQHIGGSTTYSYSSVRDNDSSYFEGLKPRPTTTTTYPQRPYRDYEDDDYDYGRYCGGGYSGGTSTSGSTVNKPSTTTPKESQVNYEMVKYVSEKYEDYILTIKGDIQAKCEEKGLDFKEFEEIFNRTIEF